MKIDYSPGKDQDFKDNGSNRVVLSVIIPTWNEAKNIGLCLDALVRQSGNVPYEIIVVDYNSSDNTGAIARAYPRVRVVSENQKGKVVARARGAREARGRVLCFTEADTVVPGGWIERLSGHFEAPGVVGAVGTYRLRLSSFFLRSLVALATPFSVWIFYLLYGHHSFRATNFAVRADVFRQSGGFDHNYQEFDDVELSRRVSTFGRIVYDTRLTVETSDRRFRGRILKFIREFASSYYCSMIKRQGVAKRYYEDIRE